jgi:[protein-PII] uridylyltransferase
MPQVDPELFDRGQFQAELALKASPIAMAGTFAG